MAERARSRLVDFEVATNPRYKPNWHHEKIARELEHIEQFGDRDYKILIVTVPPRHGKSQQCSIDFPAWYLGRNPQKEIIIASYSAELAHTFGAKTRDKVDSEQFRAIFPEVRLKEDDKAKGAWRTNKGGGYMAAGVGGPITGRGGNILLVDDPVKNREEAESEVMREKNWDWFTSTAFTRLEPKGVAIVIMTRWHLGDLAGRIIEHPEMKRRVKIIRLPALAETDGLRRKAGQALWPERYDEKAMAEIKNTVGPYDWQALYQGNPILTEKQEFKTPWYKYIDEEELEMKETAKFLTVDTAMSKRTQADHCGFVDNSVDNENFWNFKAWRARLGPEELVDALFSLHESRHYTAIGIERTAYTDGLKPFLDSEQRLRKRFLPIVELKHNETAKEIRIRGLIPRYAAGSIRHVRGRCEPLEEEQMQFPAGMKDDVLDAAAYQLQLAGVRKGGVTVHRGKGGFQNR